MKPILFFLGFVLATAPGTGFPAGNNDLDDLRIQIDHMPR